MKRIDKVLTTLFSFMSESTQAVKAFPLHHNIEPVVETIIPVPNQSYERKGIDYITPNVDILYDIPIDPTNEKEELKGIKTLPPLEERSPYLHIEKNILFQEEEKEKIERVQRIDRDIQKEIEEYNARLYEQVLARKAYNTKKKKLKEQAQGSFLRLLFGDDIQSTVYPIAVPPLLAGIFYHRVQTRILRRIGSILPIYAIRWRYFPFLFKALEQTYSKLKVKLRHLIKIYNGHYRSWWDQNVLNLYSPKERSPPYYMI